VFVAFKLHWQNFSHKLSKLLRILTQL